MMVPSGEDQRWLRDLAIPIGDPNDLVADPVLPAPKCRPSREELLERLNPADSRFGALNFADANRALSVVALVAAGAADIFAARLTSPLPFAAQVVCRLLAAGLLPVLVVWPLFDHLRCPRCRRWFFSWRTRTPRSDGVRRCSSCALPLWGRRLLQEPVAYLPIPPPTEPPPAPRWWLVFWRWNHLLISLQRLDGMALVADDDSITLRRRLRKTVTLLADDVAALEVGGSREAGRRPRYSVSAISRRGTRQLLVDGIRKEPHAQFLAQALRDLWRIPG